MLRILTNRKRNRKGFTMLETLAVVAVIAIVAAIAVTSIVLINKSITLKENNDYAKTIFTAAQANLAEMRSAGTLGLLDNDQNNFAAKKQTGDADGTPPSGYLYTYSSTKSDDITGTAAMYYETVLPKLSVEDSIRTRNVIIEYSPKNGNIYSVFYSDKGNIVKDYEDGTLSRSEEYLKKNKIGYCDGSGMTFEEMGVYNIDSKLEFSNAQNAVINVIIPTVAADGTTIIPNTTYKNLEVTLTITGEQSGKKFIKAIKTYGDVSNCLPSANSVTVSCTLDSLTADGSFAKFAEGTGLIPGENLMVTAEAMFTPGESDSIVIIKNSTLASINPMFQALTKSAESEKYVLSIGNGRHLQNMNAVSDTISATVEAVSFVGESVQTGENQTKNVIKWTDENAFTPINNATLFGKVEGNVKGAAMVYGNGVEIEGLKINSTADNVGLFTELNTEVNGVIITDPSVKGGKNTGVLAGITGASAKITNCKVTMAAATSSVEGTEKVGGLIGYADGTSIDGVTATMGKISAVKKAGTEYSVAGGIAGVLKNSTLKNTKASLASTVTGDMAGGAVGEAIGIVTLESVDVVQTSSEKSAIISEAGIIDKGNGIYGTAAGVVAKSSRDGDSDTENLTLNVVKATVYNVTSKHYAAGLTGETHKTTINDSLVTIKGTIAGIAAGGAIADNGTDSELKKVQVVFDADGNNTAAVTHIKTEEDEDEDNEEREEIKTFAAGFAYNLRGNVEECSVSGEGVIDAKQAAGFVYSTSSGQTNTIKNCAVALDGRISGVKPEKDENGNAIDKNIPNTNAAGFIYSLSSNYTVENCYVAPAPYDKLHESDYTNKSLQITGSGFVHENNGTVTISRALGTVTGNAFATVNKGTISRSLANINGKSEVSSKAYELPFVGTNNGTISYSYGWSDSAVKEIPCTNTNNKVIGSYFVGKESNVIIYNNSGAKSLGTIKTDLLTGDAILKTLNPTSGTAVWTAHKTNELEAYPYSPSLRDTEYPYPMNGIHMGDWTAPSSAGYDYGVLYYEKYADNSYGVEIRTLPNTGAGKTPAYNENTKTPSNLDNTKKIIDAGYALYMRDGQKPVEDKAIIGDKITDANLLTAANLANHFAIHKLNTTAAAFELAVGTNKISVNTNYAAAFNVTNNTYRIRTAAQLQKIAATGTYNIEQNIAVSGLTTAPISTFSGTLNGNGKTISGLTTPLIGTLNGGTVSNCNVDGTISTATGAVGGFIGTAKGNATVSGCTSNVEVSVTGANCGIFVGSAEATVKFTNCVSTAANAKSLPFGNVSPVSASELGAPTHYSETNHTSGIITTVPSDLKSTTATSASNNTYNMTGCKIKLNGTTVDAVSTVYYYTVVASEELTQAANTESYTAVETKPTYEELYSNTTANHYAKTDIGYETVNIKLVETVVDDTTVPPTTVQSYVLCVGNTETAITNMAEPVAIDLYIKEYTLPTSGTFALKFAGEGSGAISDSALWTAAAGGVWTSVTDPTSTITVTAVNANTVSVNGETYTLYKHTKTTTLTNLGPANYLTGTAIQ